MIKVRFDEKTKKVGNSYPGTITVPQPYVEITEAEHNQIRATEVPEGKAYYCIDGNFTIQDDTELLKEQNNNKIKLQIDELEATQTRSMREILVSPNDFAKNKLIEINNQIVELRKQLTS